MESLRVPASRKHKETDGGGGGEKRTRFVDSESIGKAGKGQCRNLSALPYRKSLHRQTIRNSNAKHVEVGILTLTLP
jgi:hypothetical protein